MDPSNQPGDVGGYGPVLSRGDHNAARSSPFDEKEVEVRREGSGGGGNDGGEGVPSGVVAAAVHEPPPAVGGRPPVRLRRRDARTRSSEASPLLNQLTMDLVQIAPDSMRVGEVDVVSDFIREAGNVEQLDNLRIQSFLSGFRAGLTVPLDEDYKHKVRCVQVDEDYRATILGFALSLERRTNYHRRPNRGANGPEEPQEPQEPPQPRPPAHRALIPRFGGRLERYPYR